MVGIMVGSDGGTRNTRQALQCFREALESCSSTVDILETIASYHDQPEHAEGS